MNECIKKPLILSLLFAVPCAALLWLGSFEASADMSGSAESEEVTEVRKERAGEVDWAQGPHWLGKAEFVHWANLLANPKRLDGERFWIRGVLSVIKPAEGERPDLRLFISTERKIFKDDSSSLVVMADEPFASAYAGGNLDQWEKLDGRFCSLQGEFELNPAFIEGEEVGRMTPPFYLLVHGENSIDIASP